MLTYLLRTWRIQPGYLLIISAAFLWGTYGLFIRALPYPPGVILFFRFLFGFIGLLAVAAARRDLTCLKQSPHWKGLAVAAVFCCLAWLGYTYSLAHTSVANAVFLTYTAPLFVVLLAPLALKEVVEKKSVLALLLSITGTVSIVGYSGLFAAGSSWQGDLAALFGGITYATFILMLKRLPGELLGFASNIYISGFIVLLTFPFAVHSMRLLSLSGFLILVVMGLFLQAVAATIYHLGLRSVKAQHAGILTYIEPLSATMLAIFFLQESLTWGSFLGGLLIIGGGMIIMIRRKTAAFELPPTAGVHHTGEIIKASAMQPEAEEKQGGFKNV